jgi:hypothetical protein
MVGLRNHQRQHTTTIDQRRTTALHKTMVRKVAMMDMRRVAITDMMMDMEMEMEMEGMAMRRTMTMDTDKTDPEEIEGEEGVVVEEDIHYKTTKIIRRVPDMAALLDRAEVVLI